MYFMYEQLSLKYIAHNIAAISDVYLTQLLLVSFILTSIFHQMFSSVASR